MNHDQPRPKVTVEDLLRVKRAERPPAEFWIRFEQELRAKQLAAIVDRRPWWHAASRKFAGMARLHLPLGASAVLAITFLTVRQYRDTSPSAQEVSTSPAASALTIAAPSEGGPAFSTPVTAPAAVSSVGVAAATLAEPMVASNVRPGEISRVISMLGVDSRVDGSPRDATPSARLIAANLALAQMIEPDLSAAPGNNRGFETRGLPAVRPAETEPLAQMSTPKYRTSARYLTTALPAGYVFETASVRPAEPVRSRVNDRPLRDDSVSRVGVDNGGVFWKL